MVPESQSCFQHLMPREMSGEGLRGNGEFHTIPHHSRMSLGWIAISHHEFWRK